MKINIVRKATESFAFDVIAKYIQRRAECGHRSERISAFWKCDIRQFSSTGQVPGTRILSTSTGQSTGIWENDRTVDHEDKHGEASDFRFKLYR